MNTNRKKEYYMTPDDLEDNEFQYERKYIPRRGNKETFWEAKERVTKNIRGTKFINFRRKLSFDEMKNLVRMYKLHYDKNTIVSYKQDFGDYVWIGYDDKNQRLFAVQKGASLYSMVRGMKGEAGKKEVLFIIDNISYNQAEKIAKRYKIKGTRSRIYYPIASESMVEDSNAMSGIRNMFGDKN
jgi:hypothetical protein